VGLSTLSTAQVRALTMIVGAAPAYSEDWCIRNLVPERTFRALTRKGAVRFCKDTGKWSITPKARRALPGVPPPRPDASI